MKVLMQARVDLFEKPGGDLVQMQKTRSALAQQGVAVDISTDLKPSLHGYDLVHLYNITRVHETAAQLRHARRHGMPAVVSPIYHRQEEIERYERRGRTGSLSTLNRVLRTTAQREALKNLVRLRDSRQRAAALRSICSGFVNEQKYVLGESQGWIVLAEAESQAMQQRFAVQNMSVVARNAVDPEFFGADAAGFVAQRGLRDFVLCVSRIEDRKNQIRLIKALAGQGLQLVFVGGVNRNHPAYVARFLELVRQNASWVHYLGPLPYAELPALYAAARLHVLPSWFEVVSLTAMEAAAAGCAGVVSDTGYMREYLGSGVAYCDPDSVDSIRDACRLAPQLGPAGRLAGAMGAFTWQRTARETLSAYRKALS